MEHILKLHDDEIRRQEISFGLQRNGCVCQEHMKFNRDTLEWEMKNRDGEQPPKEMNEATLALIADTMSAFQSS